MTSAAGSVLGSILLALSSLSNTTVGLIAVTAAALAYYKYMNSCPDDWRRYGVTCPKLPRTFLFRSDFRSKMAELFQQYGDIIGVHGRGNMMMMTTNLELLRHILIKDFNNFVDRGGAFKSNSPFGKSLFFAKGSEWRRHRQIVSPTFSSGKLKHISKSVDKSAQDLTDYFAKCAKNGQLVPIKKLTGQYTCEIIAKTAFGLDAHFIGKEDIEFFQNATNILKINSRTGLLRSIFMILSTIPHLENIATNIFKIQYFDPVEQSADKYFGATLSSTIAERRQLQKSGVKRPHVDFLDLLLKANDAIAAGKLKASDEDFSSADWNHGGKSIQSLSDEEMIGHSMLVIFAGMETTASTLQFVLCQLAAHPDIQEKVFQEITDVIKADTPTPEELNSLTYTEQVINETLRMYAPVPNVNRMAKETRTYNGVTIPKGTVVNIPYFYILRDPKNFPDPEKFDPDRFSKEQKEKRDPLSFAVFGHGPRLCVGMRLAYLELKQGLVHILRKLKVVLNDSTEPKIGSTGIIKITPNGLLTPEKEIMLAFELRETKNLT